MDRIISKLLVYGDIDPESILMKVGEICAEFRSGRYDETDLITRCYKQTKRILEVSTDYGFDRNLWQCYLTFLLITDENPFTLTSEKVGAKDGSVNHFVKNDYKMFMQLFHYSFKELEEKLGIDCFSTITDYKAIGKPELMYNKNVSEKVNELSLKLSMAEDEEEFFTLMTDFYKAYGVGLFGLNKAFRIEKKADGDIYFRAINNMDKVMLCDLIGDIRQNRLCLLQLSFIDQLQRLRIHLIHPLAVDKGLLLKCGTLILRHNLKRLLCDRFNQLTGILLPAKLQRKLVQIGDILYNIAGQLAINLLHQFIDSHGTHSPFSRNNKMNGREACPLPLTAITVQFRQSVTRTAAASSIEIGR